MIQRITLPGDLSTLLLVLGLIAVVVYIVTTISESRELPRERKDSSFNPAARENRMSPIIAEYYKAAADGDPDDYNYWIKTAEMFSGGAKNDRK